MVDKLGAMFSAAFGAVQAIVSTVVDVVPGIWNKFGDIIMTPPSVWEENVKTTHRRDPRHAHRGVQPHQVDPDRQVGRGMGRDQADSLRAWDTVGASLEVLWSYISGAFEAIGRIMVDLWNRAWDGVKAAFQRGVDG